MLLSHEEDSVARTGYAAEFRRRVLDLLAAGRPVGDVARDLGITDQASGGRVLRHLRHPRSDHRTWHRRGPPSRRTADATRWYRGDLGAASLSASASFIATNRISSGSPTSRSIRLEKARSTATSSSTPGRVAWSGGRSTPRPAPRVTEGL